MIKIRLFPALVTLVTLGVLGFWPIALANSPEPSISVRADGPTVQYGNSACTTSPQTQAANAPIVQYGAPACNAYPSYQRPGNAPKQKNQNKETLRANKWSDWVGQALNNIPEVKGELDTWAQYALSPPQIIASTSNATAPSEYTSFPLGLSDGKPPTLTVFVSPRTEEENESGSKFSPYMLKLRSLLTQAYNQLSRQYYQLGGAYIRQDLLSQRRQALEELREVNRDAANSGDGSWAGIIYLDNVLEEVNAEIAKNDLLIDVLAFNFQKYPQWDELQIGALQVWNKDDFWNFYPKTPGAAGADAVPGDEVNRLFAQFQAASEVTSTTRTSNSLQGVIDQLDSEPSASDADFAAGEEVITTAKLKELESRIKYIDKLLGVHEGAKVIFSFIAPPTSKPGTGSPAAPLAANYAKDGSPNSGILIGILILAVAILALWHFRRANAESIPSQPEPLRNETAKAPQENQESSVPPTRDNS